MDTCNILGVNIAATNMKETLQYIERNLAAMYGKYICISNVHTTILAHDYEYYKNIQNNSILALPDGKPLSVICKKRGFKKTNRIAGPDLMDEIFRLSENSGYRHYFYGSTKSTLDKLEKNLKLKYPALNIVGMYAPPFRKLSEEEDHHIVNIINHKIVDFVWIGLGAPKQEIWMSEHQDKINGLMIGVGAGFDYYADNLKRAPLWMQKMSLEWAFRLIQDPKRLLKRYLITNSKFIYFIVFSR